MTTAGLGTTRSFDRFTNDLVPALRAHYAANKTAALERARGLGHDIGKLHATKAGSGWRRSLTFCMTCGASVVVDELPSYLGDDYVHGDALEGTCKGTTYPRFHGKDIVR